VKPIIIIQARTGSTRLPRKMVKPFFEDKNVLEILISRLKEVVDENYVKDIIVATTENVNDDAIAEICTKLSVKSYRGSEQDVLQRFIDTAESQNSNTIIRICADNVFLDINSLKKLATYLNNTNDDYVSFRTKEGKPSILTHYGFFAEGVTLAALKRVIKLTDSPLFHEHVTNRIHSYPLDFRVNLLPIEDFIPGLESYKDLRLTLDTMEDFDVQQKIYSDLVSRPDGLTPKEIIKYLDEEHPEFYDIMKSTINANKK